ncbi:MAG: galactose-1-phosphate uridylyltransferase [Planctomycetaceae bacterium]|nr:galactose-1-phosphate uridylyltransferase [Planctomycetaceae bacterium]
MSELRQDPITGRNVIIAEGRAARPNEFVSVATKAATPCPFCVGNESLTPDAILSYPRDRKDAAWQVRVVPNKYPAVQWAAAAVGTHEVIIESPEHIVSLSELSDEQAALAFRAYQERLQALGQDERLGFTFIFKNARAAGGASLEHLHSQLIGMEFVPPEIQLQTSKAGEYRVLHGRCIFCDLLADEADGNRVVSESEHFIVFCPYASRFAYEMWVVPKAHEQSFEDASAEQSNELAKITVQAVRKLEACLDSPAYNYWIHTAPFRMSRHDDFHWHIEIAPRVARLAGFELGSGCFINPVAPEHAAERLRNV